jgi:hypothetical protein
LLFPVRAFVRSTNQASGQFPAGIEFNPCALALRDQMSSSSLDEKEKELRLGDPEVAAREPREYEPIKTEPLTTGAEKDLEANLETRSSRGNLSRLQSHSSALTDASSDITDAKSSTIGKKRWYKKINPLKWGPKPPVPQKRDVCPEYRAGWFSLLTFQWIAPLMTVSI